MCEAREKRNVVVWCGGNHGTVTARHRITAHRHHHNVAHRSSPSPQRHRYQRGAEKRGKIEARWRGSADAADIIRLERLR
jgi:hypothetical protein